MTTQRLTGLCAWAMACAVMIAVSPNAALALPIPSGQVTYSYPGQQPRGDLNPVYGDTGGGQLSDGFFPADSFASGNWVGYNDDVIQSGQPEPRIDFDLGGTYNLNSTSITYVAGGLAGILGPDSLEVRYSTNGGATYSAAPDATFTGFNQSDDNASQFPVTDTIPLAGAGVTNVRLDFIQDQDAGNNFSEWVFLGEVNFDGAGTPNPGPSQTYKDAVLADNPLLYWSFDENSGNAQSLVNPSAANELVPQGSAGRVQSHITPGGIDLGRAASFNGTDGTRFFAADLFGPGGGPGVGFIGTQLWAVEFWFKTDSAGAQYLSESTGVGGNNDPGIIYGFNAGGPDQLELFKGDRFGPTGVSQDEWHHAVIAFYGNSGGFADNLREIYLDGVLVATDTITGFSTGHSLGAYAIGATSVAGGVNPFSGMIDEWAIYELGNLPDLDARRAHVADIAAHFNLREVNVVPEPASATLALLGGLALLRRRRRVTA